ncbi:MAG: class I SAM-dependent methyltransferase [Gemmatimonadales bacterium]|nr:class I SAM-dependent methyltransferase [Gemmatimonadales bacterium]
MLRQILSRPFFRMAGKAIRHPSRAVLRLVLKARLRRSSVDEERGRLLALLSRQFGVEAPGLLAEYRRSEFHTWFQQRRAALDRFDGPYRFGTTGVFECEALYLLVRAARPRVVVDTGVLYGGSTAHILEALARNGVGKLHSIDIGRSPDEPPHDHFVRPEVQSRWELVIGDSRRELPPLLRRCETIDMFHHDSLHTWDHMTWEFETAFPHLSADGILSSDDIQNPPDLPGIFRENAFPAFCRRRAMQYASFRNMGMAFRTSGSPATTEAQPERVSDPAHLPPTWARSRSWVESPI